MHSLLAGGTLSGGGVEEDGRDVFDREGGPPVVDDDVITVGATCMVLYLVMSSLEHILCALTGCTCQTAISPSTTY